MYPKIDLVGRFTNPPESHPIPTSGPATASPASEPPSFSTSLRVVIAEGLRVAPPVPKPAAAAITPDVAGSERLGIQNCDYERKILEELERNSIASVLAHNGTELRKQDWYEATLSRAMADGFSREEATFGLAVALATSRRPSDGPNVTEAAGKVKYLKELKYDGAAAVGALVTHNGDANAAANELCE